MLKRNDICHCGSGKKYKKCCMESDKLAYESKKREAIFDDKKERADKIYTESVLKLSSYLEDLINTDSDFSSKEEKVRGEFFDGMDSSNVAANRFFASYFSYDCYIDEKNTPAMYALKKGDFTAEQSNIIASCINSYPSLFEIVKVGSKEVIIKDIFTNIEYHTLDSKILGGFTVGDYLLGRPVRIGDIYILIDLTIRIQPETKTIIYNTLMDVYEQNKESIPNIEYFVYINTLFFYKYMLQLLQLSDYADEKVEEMNDGVNGSNETESTDVNMDEDTLVSLISSKVNEKEVLSEMIKVWDSISDSANYVGYENGWASALEYYCRKSNGENVTQNAIAKNYGVSSSTLAKRNKEIAALLGGK